MKWLSLLLLSVSTLWGQVPQQLALPKLVAFTSSNFIPPVFAVLSGLSWQMPGGDLHDCPVTSCTAPPDQSITLSGTPGTLFNVTLLIRGVIELKPYTAGTVMGSGFVNRDGFPPGSSYNTYYLIISDTLHTYYLNNGASGGTVAVDYTITVPMREGASLLLHCDTGGDGVEVCNHDALVITPLAGEPPITAVVQPFAGQWLQMDVIAVN